MCVASSIDRCSRGPTMVHLRNRYSFCTIVMTNPVILLFDVTQSWSHSSLIMDKQCRLQPLELLLLRYLATCLRSGTSQWGYIEILLNMYAKISMHRVGLLTFSWSILCFVFSANTHSAEGKPRNRKFARLLTNASLYPSMA